MKRHIAKTDLDHRCVVLYMQIPNREDHALICQVDSLPPRFEQAVMDVLESPEGQNDPSFAAVLGRRVLPDTGENLLQAMHDRGYLTAIPIDRVFMLPVPNMPFPLRQIIEQMGGTVPTDRQTPVSDHSATTKFNPHTENAIADSNERSRGPAQSLLDQATLLEQEAALKRAEAYHLDPSLRPVPLSEEIEAAKPKKTRKVASA